MSQKNLSVSKKTHRFLINKLKDKETFQIYKKFEKNLNLNEDFIVAVSGGPDSLALSFLSKIYSIKKNLKVEFFHVDHKLRINSTKEAKFLKLILKKISTKIGILTWIGSKPNSNIQSVARNKRYQLLINKAKKLKFNNILLGHHGDDLVENFFIRILRGSGLNGMISFDKKTEYQNINLIRPLLIFPKKDLETITNKIFKIYIQDPTNNNKEFKRVKIRNFIKNLELEGLDKDKFNLTINNLKYANKSIKFFVDQNVQNNATTIRLKKHIILNKDFFYQPEEVVFRSLSQVLKMVGKKYYPVRGKKINKIINQIKVNPFTKTTLGNCILKRVNNTIIVSKEQ